jgi:hypothetical protein
MGSAMRRSDLPMGALLALSLGALGCAFSKDAARARASKEYDCPKEHIKKVKHIGSHRRGEVYEVYACGVIATYVCDDYGNCFKESPDR